jgi:hypothetical protein
LVLGNFGQTALRYLTGRLGPENKVVGRADTNQNSNGGFGGGTMNHWFQINLNTNAWIIVAKGPPRPQYIQVSAYDLNYNPIQERMIFDNDSLTTTADGRVVHPYFGHVMGANSNLYNQFAPNRIDRGNELYYVLEPGSYLICVSSTRNELLDYAVGLVIEVADPNPFLLLEDFNYLLFEDFDQVLCDLAPDFTGAEDHEHSLTEWTTAWNREHQDTDKLPAVFPPLTTVP